MAQFDFKRLDKNDQGVIIAGAVVFVAGFLPWFGGLGGAIIGWSAGFTGFMSILLCLLAAVFVGLRAAQVGMPKLPAGPALVALGLAGLGLLLMVIRFATLPRGSGFGLSYGPRFGLFLALIAAIAEVAFAFLAFRSSGETLPSSRPGGTGTGTGTAPPAA